MRTVYSFWKPVSLICYLSGCTTMVAHNEIEPYIKEKSKRNALETLAEDYCRQLRATPDSNLSPKLPDYIYTTDGCSVWPDKSWKACCIVHDISYWCGGNDEDRQQADEWLEQCVNAQGMGGIIYVGVRIGGAPWLPTPWRWGYGWDNWPHDYESIEHTSSIKELLEKLKLRSLIEEQLTKRDNDQSK